MTPDNLDHEYQERLKVGAYGCQTQQELAAVKQELAELKAAVDWYCGQHAESIRLLTADILLAAYRQQQTNHDNTTKGSV